MSSSNPGPAVTTTNVTVVDFGNIQLEAVLQITISPAAVAANTTAEQTFTVNGLLIGDFIEINKPSAQAGLGIVNTRVSALNTLAITFSNNTASPITPTPSEIYQCMVSRPLASYVANPATALPL